MIHYDTYCIHLISMWFFPCGTCGGMTGQNFSGRFPYTKPTTCLLTVQCTDSGYERFSLSFSKLNIHLLGDPHVFPKTRLLAFFALLILFQWFLESLLIPFPVKWQDSSVHFYWKVYIFNLRFVFNYPIMAPSATSQVSADTLAELKDIATRLRIHSINSTTASKSG